MVKYYYKPRWNLYLNLVYDSVLKKQTVFNYTNFEHEVFNKVELPFTLEHHNLTEQATSKLNILFPRELIAFFV